MPELKINIGADVQQAVNGINQVNQAVNKIQPAMQKAAAGTNQATFALTNIGRVAQDLPYGFLGIANNITPLIESFQRVSAQAKETGSSFGRLLLSSLKGGGGLILGFSLATAAIQLLTSGFQNFGRKASEAKQKTDEFKTSIQGIFKGAAEEATNVGSLIQVLKSETETRERKLAALKEIQKINPENFNQLKLEGDAVAGLDAAYKNYLDSLKTVIAVKIKQAQLELAITQLLQKQGITLVGNEKLLFEGTQRLQDLFINAGKDGFNPLAESAKKARNNSEKELLKLKQDIDIIFKDIQTLSKGIKLEIKPNKIKADKDKLKSESDLLIRARLQPIPPLESDIDEVLKATQKAFEDRAKALPQLSAGSSAFLNIKREIQITKDIFENVKKDAEKTAQFISSAFGNAFDSMFDSLKAGQNIATAFFNSLITIVQNLITKFIQAQIEAFVLKLILGGPGAIGVNPHPLPHRAGGGPVIAGQPYIVGEHRPELFVPRQNGTIIPNTSVQGVSAQPQILVVEGRLSLREIVLGVARELRYQHNNT